MRKKFFCGTGMLLDGAAWPDLFPRGELKSGAYTETLNAERQTGPLGRARGLAFCGAGFGPAENLG